MSVKRFIIAIVFFSFSFSISAASILNINTTKTRIRADYELVKVNEDEDMGMLGIHYDFFPFEKYRNWYLGVGSLGAIHGDRGGFFTGGLTAGWLHPITTNHSIDIGTHIAGGGGASAFPGSGMVLRSHIGYEYDAEEIALRAGFAHTKFIDTTNPNSSDVHPYVGITLTSSFINSFLSSESLFSNSGYKTSRLEFAPAVMAYSPDDNVLLRSGRPQNETAALLGMQLNWFDNSSNLYGTVGFYGAGNGGIDGYATVLGGVGWRYKLTKNLYLDAKGMVGMGGGGDVDTGGGLYYQPMLGAGFIINSDFSVDLLAGRTLADDGGFESNTLLLALNWTPKVIIPNADNLSLAAITAKPVSWSAFVDHKTYLPKNGILDKGGQPYSDSINLLGFGIEKPITDWLALSGRGYGAWTGGVGAYAEGLFGVKIYSDDFWPGHDLQVEGRYDIGVAGGGGMEVGDGIINQMVVGVGYPLFDSVLLRAEFGKMQAVDGTFEANTIVFGIDWRFGLPVKR